MGWKGTFMKDYIKQPWLEHQITRYLKRLRLWLKDGYELTEEQRGILMWIVEKCYLEDTPDAISKRKKVL